MGGQTPLGVAGWLLLVSLFALRRCRVIGDMTAQQAEALAHYLHTKRPGERAWTRSACIDALRVAFREITSDCQRLEQAALNAVNDPSVRTPQVIGMRGRHWELGSDLDKRREGTKGITCVRCRLTYMPSPTLAHECPEKADVAAAVSAAKAAIRPTATFDGGGAG